MYKSLVAKSHIGVTTFVAQLVQFFSDIGLTLHDDQNGSDYMVYKMEGETSQYPPCYFKMSYDTAVADPNYVYFDFYYYWNNSTQTGYGLGHNCPLTIKTASGSTYFAWCSGDSTAFFLRTLVQSDVSELIAGFVDAPTDPTVTTLTSPATAGDDVVLSVSDSSGFHVGQDYQVFSEVGEGRDLATVSALATGQITVSTLATSVSAGSSIGSYPCPFFFHGKSPLNTEKGAMPNHPGACSGTGGSINASASAIRKLYIQTLTDSEARAGDKRVLYPLNITSGMSSYGICGYVLNNILFGNSTDMAAEDVLTIGVPEEGTATSGGATTITDTTKTWTTNQHQGRYIVIYAGTGYGQTRKIVSNTATEATVSTWDTNPDDTSMYRIIDKIYRAFDELGSESACLLFVREEV